MIETIVEALKRFYGRLEPCKIPEGEKWVVPEGIIWYCGDYVEINGELIIDGELKVM